MHSAGSHGSLHDKCTLAATTDMPQDQHRRTRRKHKESTRRSTKAEEHTPWVLRFSGQDESRVDSDRLGFWGDLDELGTLIGTCSWAFHRHGRKTCRDWKS